MAKDIGYYVYAGDGTIELDALAGDNGLQFDGRFTAVRFSGGIHGNWLTIERHNIKAHDAKGFDPAYVTLTSFLKPISKKLSDGTWETHYETEL